MKPWTPPRRSRGYLQEVPIATAIVLIAVAALMGYVGVTGKKLLVAVDGLVLLAYFYYVILARGWRPGSAAPVRLMLRWMLFGALALLLVGGVAAFALVYTEQ
jgi:hypothetical protein